MKEARRGPKVAHLTSVHAATDVRIVFKECATLAEAGYDVVLIAPGPPRLLPSNVRHHAIPAPRNRAERFARTMWHIYRAARAEAADVYHFHDPELILLGIALRLRGARVVFDVHEDIPLDLQTKPWIPPVLRPAVSVAASVVLRCVQGWFTAIVPATPSIARSFKHRRTVVVRNYPRLSDLAFAQEYKPFAQRSRVALYMGSITRLRGIEEMVLAMAEPAMASDAQLLLAGEFRRFGAARARRETPGLVARRSARPARSSCSCSRTCERPRRATAPAPRTKS